MKQKFDIIKSTCVPLPLENIDTDQIIPARFLKATTREGFGDNLFRDWRYDKNGNPRRAISDSQLYKMAGNSIVVSCLDLIFENLFFPQKREGELF